MSMPERQNVLLATKLRRRRPASTRTMHVSVVEVGACYERLYTYVHSSLHEALFAHIVHAATLLLR